MSQNVALDAQYGVVRILRPFTGFATTYTGVDSRTLLQMTQGGTALDLEAGQPGYDPNLVAGLASPIGAQALIWLPQIQPRTPATDGEYNWRVSFRLRNAYDYRQRRIPFHYAKQAPGVADAGNARVVIPAAIQSFTVNGAEPTGAGGMTQNVRLEDFSTRFNGDGTTTFLPLVPGGGTGHIQQGLYDAAVPNTAFAPLYTLVEVPVSGDELLIGLYRAPVSQAAPSNWNFAAGQADFIVSQLLGDGLGQVFPDIGVYVMFGSAT